MIAEILNNKPVLVGLHLGFAILGIDSFLWLAGEIIADPEKRRRLKMVALGGVISFVMSWLIGGYYYVTYYGKLVKPEILAGTAPWAHAVAMEAKEHIFLFIVPLALTAVFLSFVSKEELNFNNLRRPFLSLVIFIALAALALGLMGYIISAAARWG
ncbi:MAG: hypothetical protein A3J48_00080 [Candidatus Doudnabacteria bacterium RIFCSPHIGHO2_02_FULL_46_11]|uniref:DUF2231 domain-containing protein n=1 Tax=Candidatus Doudnabacteria bacterium RIFCSPHIGHO2_02_FULL_46_11 TaxID=1817832 RepID=A0A1F5P9F1_9BACT|nr:MAG: hypothetical protein A3J48_00080 [Candidatus Doudnabacteria bacterium RIFCSPHIGHO2_02_FULL_46_11]